MKRVIITGASGPLGAIIARKCLSRGLEVLAIVRPGSQRISNIPQDPKVRIVEHSASELSSLELGEDSPYDACIHLAWMHTDSIGRSNPRFQANNIPMTLDVAEFAKRMGCRVMVAAGSQAEYGRLSGVADEEMPENPLVPYGMAKVAACRLLMEYGRQHDMRVNWMRIFSVYGPYENEYVLTSYVIRTLLEKREPELTPCEQLWDFLYTEDVARAFLDVAEKAKKSGIYCLGSGEARPLREYVETIRDEIDPALPLGIGKKPYGAGQIMHLQADIGKLTREIGFAPQIPFREGARRTIEWYRGRMER